MSAVNDVFLAFLLVAAVVVATFSIACVMSASPGATAETQSPATETATPTPSPWSEWGMGGVETLAENKVLYYPYYPSPIIGSSIKVVGFDELVQRGFGSGGSRIDRYDYAFQFNLTDGTEHTANVTIGYDQTNYNLGVHYMDIDGVGKYSI